MHTEPFSHCSFSLFIVISIQKLIFWMTLTDFEFSDNRRVKKKYWNPRSWHSLSYHNCYAFKLKYSDVFNVSWDSKYYFINDNKKLRHSIFAKLNRTLWHSIQMRRFWYWSVFAYIKCFIVFVSNKNQRARCADCLLYFQRLFDSFETFFGSRVIIHCLTLAVNQMGFLC